MSCKKLDNKIIELAYGELSGADAAEVQKHVDACSRCRRSYEQYKQTAHAVWNLPGAPEPSLSVERLRQAILSRQIRQSPILNWKFATGSLVAGLAAVAFVMFFSRSAPRETYVASHTTVSDTFLTMPGANEVTSASSLPPVAVHTSEEAPTRAAAAHQGENVKNKRYRPLRSSLPAVVKQPTPARSEVVRSEPPAGGVAIDIGEEEVIMIQPNPTAEDGTSDAVRSRDDVFIGG